MVFFMLIILKLFVRIDQKPNSVKIYRIITNGYYDGYITRYDCKRNIITYMNNVYLSVEEFEKAMHIL